MKEQNKLIAEFMGSRYINEPFFDKSTNKMVDYWYWTKPDNGWPSSKLTNQEYSTAYMIENWAYHTSWDWLIPVVEKIESLNWSTELRYTAGVGHNMYFISAGAELNRTKSSTDKIEAVYNAVIFFINWYNQQNQAQ